MDKDKRIRMTDYIGSTTDTHELEYPSWAGHVHNSLNSKELKERKGVAS